jgi:hypothetical protein
MRAPCMGDASICKIEELQLVLYVEIIGKMFAVQMFLLLFKVMSTERLEIP